MRRLPILIVLAFALLTGCKPKMPSEVIKPSKMEKILYDYHLYQSMAQHTGTSDEQAFNQSLYLAEVLDKHGVTQAEFDSSLVYYYRHAEYFSAIYKRVAERLSSEAEEYGATMGGNANQYAQLKAQGDTADIWNGSREYLLLPYTPYNRIDFVVKPDTSFYAGDSFLLLLNTNFLWQSGTKDVTVFMAAKLASDSVVSQHLRLMSSGQSQLRLSLPPDATIKELRGFVYLRNTEPTSTTTRLLFLRDLQLVRFHRPKEVEVNTESNN